MKIATRRFVNTISGRIGLSPAILISKSTDIENPAHAALIVRPVPASYRAADCRA